MTAAPRSAIIGPRRPATFTAWRGIRVLRGAPTRPAATAPPGAATAVATGTGRTPGETAVTPGRSPPTRTIRSGGSCRRPPARSRRMGAAPPTRRSTAGRAPVPGRRSRARSTRTSTRSQPDRGSSSRAWATARCSRAMTAARAGANWASGSAGSPRLPRSKVAHRRAVEAKQRVRERVWRTLENEGAARFPGARGRIPNFRGAEAAAERLAQVPEWEAAAVMKSNPDAPQLPVRRCARREGKTLYMAVPRLAEAKPFVRVEGDPTIKRALAEGTPANVEELGNVDLVVC